MSGRSGFRAGAAGQLRAGHHFPRTAIEAFAGQDIDTAVFYPDDEQFLIERDLTVKHYEVAGTE